MTRKGEGVPRSIWDDPISRRCGIVAVPLEYIFPEGLLCHYCEKATARTRDHVVPKALGGMDSWWNLVPACARCNSRKADTMPTCMCEFCTRALALFDLGNTRWPTTKASREKAKRKKRQGRHPSLFSIKGKKLPADLSHEAHLLRHKDDPDYDWYWKKR